MNRVSHRTTIALLLILVLIVGMFLFFCEFMLNAGDWVVFPGNPHVYSGSNIGCGLIVDRSGNVLLSATDGRRYSDDLGIRKSTIHWVGDRSGYISAPAASYYSEEMAGYSMLNGLYQYAGTGGEAEMTISAKIQKVALEAMGGYKGTVAVYNYETGEILCAVSTPNYDPDNVPDISGDSTGTYEGVYLNRFTQVSYVPGSIFKIVTTTAALENMDNALAVKFTCNGTYQIGVDEVVCEGNHGSIDLKTALAKSCNCYFAQLSELIGGEKLQKCVDKLQVVEPLSFDGITTAGGSFDIENAAAVEIAWSAIGQHLDLINPCRYMTLMGAIAGGGEAKEPYIIREVTSGSEVQYRVSPASTGRIMSRKTAETLTELMRNNVISIYGDGNFPNLNVCAKSGTAEVGGGQKPNATFSGFVTDPEYPLAFVVVIENGGSGSRVCVPIISEVLQACVEVLDKE